MSDTVRLPEVFESFTEARRAGFLEMKKLKDSGQGVVGVFCTYTPVEIFMAAGLIPVSLCSTSDETVAEAEKTLPRNLCPLIKASYGFAVADKCPYMYFSDLVVGETTCDGKKKMFELLGEIKKVHVMQLPQTQNTNLALEQWRSEILILKSKVEEIFGVTISDDDLRQAIRSKNQERALLKELYELSRQSPPPLTGLEQLRILFGAGYKFDHSKKLQELREAIEALKNKAASPVDKADKRIVITGCPMGGATEKVVQAIEDSGGVVVAYENCIGAKQYDRQVRESGDPVMALAQHYLAIGCSVMTPNPNRLELLERLCRDFKADGVVEVVLQACHTYAIETNAIGQFLKARSWPFLSLETDYSQGDVERLKNRAAAFIEML